MNEALRTGDRNAIDEFVDLLRRQKPNDGPLGQLSSYHAALFDRAAMVIEALRQPVGIDLDVLRRELDGMYEAGAAAMRRAIIAGLFDGAKRMKGKHAAGVQMAAEALRDTPETAWRAPTGEGART